MKQDVYNNTKLGASFFIFTLILAHANPLSSKENDWGVGVGLGGIYYPHYLGADESDLLILPFPYIEYYGEKFQINEDGFAAEIFDSDRFDLNMSMSSALPVNDDDNETRRGMDDLNLILEAGPVLEIALKRWERSELRLDLPLRAAIEIDFSTTPDYAGWTFDPKLHFETKKDNRKLEWQLGALFGSEKFNSIYYEVGEEDVTPERPEYDAKAGFIGWRSSLGAKIERGNWRYFGYLRYYNLQSAANDSSPLMQSNDYWSGGVGLAWMFKLPSEKAKEK